MRLIKQEHAEWEKNQQEWLQEQEQKEKKRIQEREEKIKRKQEYLENLPQKQFDMILTGRRNRCHKCCAIELAEFYANHHPQCPVNTGEDLEPGLAYLRDNVLDEQTYTMIKGNARPGESPKDAIKGVFSAAPPQQH